MEAIFWRGAAALLLWLCLIANSASAPLASTQVQATMTRVEAFMTEFGIDVAGYAKTREPMAEMVSVDHPYLQGNDGAYIDGRVFISDRANSDCVSLTLVHELVHDATAKFGLFPTVANSELRDAFESLADAITEAAAQDPYLPGCLPKRRFAFDRANLVTLAAPRRASPAAPATRVSLETTNPEPPAQVQPYGLAMRRCRGPSGTTCIALAPPL